MRLRVAICHLSIGSDTNTRIGVLFCMKCITRMISEVCTSLQLDDQFPRILRVWRRKGYIL
jgi:hypothetical protein